MKLFIIVPSIINVSVVITCAEGML